jgi:hypothetical protein
MGIVFGLLLRGQKTRLGRGKLVEDLLRKPLVLPQLIGPDVGHPLHGRVGDHLGVRFKQLDAEQTVVIGRLVFGCDAQPPVIGVKSHRFISDGC